MCSLDISSLYTNIPVTESIDLILNELYINNGTLCNEIKQENFCKLFPLSLNYTYFKFNAKICQQMEGLAMGQSLSPIIANIF